jgi:cephalosporin hydroxylase
MLQEYCDNIYTDKNTTHSYLELYETLFQHKKDTAINVLEIGIGPPPSNGGSILMWEKYFTQAHIYALDIIPIADVNPAILNKHRIHVYASVNAYDPNIVKRFFLTHPKRFDILLDDGPHTLESMIAFVTLYSRVMKSDGILVIEDVQSMEWVDVLRTYTPEPLKPFIQVYDLREKKGRYDDIVFVINKSIKI